MLATDKVRFQGQEVAAVIAESAYIAKDACELIDVDYEPLEVLTSLQQALAEGAAVIRDEKEGQADNHIYDWEAGDKEATGQGLRRSRQGGRAGHLLPALPPRAARVLRLHRGREPRNGESDDLHDLAGPARTPHAFALVAGLPEHKIRIISPDLGGGFGNKVPVYPGYVVATAASLLIGRLVKWVEDRTGNLISTGFARDYHMHGELALKDGKITGLRVKMLSDNGAFFSDAQPTSCKAGLFHIVTGSYDIPAAHVETTGAYTNKAPGGVAYRCSFRVTEASYLIERLVQNAAYEIGVDPADFRKQNFIKPEQFLYKSATGFEYDSGDYVAAMDKTLEMLGYDDLRREQAEARKEGRLIGIGLASFTEVLPATGPSTRSPACA